MRIRELAAGIAGAYGLELFDVTYGREAGRNVLRVVLDRPGPSATAEDSVSLEHFQKVSEELSAVLDVDDVGPDEYTLEVSSPGLDRPLRSRDDSQRFAGRLAKIVTAEPIAAGKTDVFTISVPVTLATTVTSTALDCEFLTVETGTGTFSTATLSGNASGSATVCQPLPRISIQKSEATPVATGPNSFALTYTITVTNHGNANGDYNLDDTFAFGAGVTRGAPVVYYSGASTGTLNTPINGLFTGATPFTRIVTAEPIAAGKTHVFTISVPVTVATTATSTALDCEFLTVETLRSSMAF